MSGKKPTHEISVKDLETQDRGRIGVAWENEDGSFTLKLSPCASLTYDNTKGKSVVLFPIRTEAEWARWRAAKGMKASKDAAAGDPQE